MRFTPKPIKDNVNISPASPLRELVILLGGIVGGLLIIYLALGSVLDILIERFPAKLDYISGTFFSKAYNLQESSSSTETKIQGLLNELTKNLPEQYLEFTVHVQDSPDVNAMALPGGHIMIFSGLLKEIESENELAMILAHELGHFVNRDHLKGLGRGLVLVFISSFLFGADSLISDFTQKTLTTVDLKFSRQQEVAADRFAIELLNKKYGHVGGACDFFERIKGKESLPRFAKFLSTHPYPIDRIIILRKEIRENGYVIGEKVLLDPSLRKETKKPK